MKTFKSVLAFLIVNLIIFVYTFAANEDYRNKSFKVTPGGSIELTTNLGNIIIYAWDKPEVAISIQGVDDGDVERLKIVQNDNDIRIFYRARKMENSSRTIFNITVPSKFNLNVNTSIGNVEFKTSVTGNIESTTSNGDIKATNLYGGPFELTTTNGDVLLSKLEGDAFIKTANGNIQTGYVAGLLNVSSNSGQIKIESVNGSVIAKSTTGDINIGDIGKDCDITTTGGDINIAKILGDAICTTQSGDISIKGSNGKIMIRSSGGDVRALGITGSIDAKTTSGSIEAEIMSNLKADSRLSTTQKEVKLYISNKVKATIDCVMRLDGVGFLQTLYTVKSDYPKEPSKVDDNSGEVREVVKLNGGGKSIKLRTTNSIISINKPRK